jgi:NitT/TauT family transport system substrate-binding protein
MTVRNRLAPGAALAASAFAVAALLTSCSGPATQATSTGDTGGQTSLRVLIGPVFFEPLHIAQREGFFEEEGLDVEIVDGGAAAQAIPQVLSGEVDIAGTGGVSLFAAVAQGMPLKAISSLQNAATDPVTSGILVPEDSPIADYADLEGKTVGLQALQETTNLATLLAVEEAGGDPASVNFVQIPLPAINEVVVKGEVDAGYNIGSFYPTGIGMGLRPLGSPANEVLTGAPNALWIATSEFIAANPDAVEAFNAAMAKAIDFANDNPEVVQDLQIELTEQDPDFIRANPVTKVAHALDRAAIEKTIAGLARFGFIPSEPAYEDVVWESAPQE